MAVIRRSSSVPSSVPTGPVSPLRRRRWLPLHRHRRPWPYGIREETLGAVAPRRRRPSWLVAGWRWARGWVTRLLAVALIVGVVVGAFTGASRSYPPAEVIPPPVQGNGLWLGYRWFSGDYDASDLERLITRVESNHLQTLFIYVGSVGFDGTLASVQGAGVDRLAAALREKGLDSSVRLLAWVRGEAGPAQSSLPPTFRLGRLPARAQLHRQLQELLGQNSWSGLHVEVQGVADGDSGFVAWLTELRESVLAPGQVLSVSVSPLRWGWLPVPLGKKSWTPAYLAQVAARADQITVQTFDTGLPLPGLYQRWLEGQVSAILSVVAQELTFLRNREATVYSILFVISSFAERRFNHYPSVENIGVASQALIASFGRERRQAPDDLHSVIQLGYGLFADWTTQEEEWEALSHYWR